MLKDLDGLNRFLIFCVLLPMVLLTFIGIMTNVFGVNSTLIIFTAAIAVAIVFLIVIRLISKKMSDN